MSKWKYFGDNEAPGVLDDVMYKIDRARELYGFPIVITSGYRASDHNASIGGVIDSAHTKGMAIDIQAPQDPFIREKLMWALGVAGFRRVESAPKHFHVDIDISKPTPAFWQGDDK